MSIKCRCHRSGIFSLGLWKLIRKIQIEYTSLREIGKIFVSNYCGYRLKGVQGVKWSKKVWQIQISAFPGRPSSQSWRNLVFLQFWAIFDGFSPWFLHFTHFWVDGRPRNEVIQILHILGDHLTPLTPLDLYPQCFTYLSFETDFWLFPLCDLYLQVLIIILRIETMYVSTKPMLQGTH